jgi:hypothetical protein
VRIRNSFPAPFPTPFPACLLCPPLRTSASKPNPRAQGTHRIARDKVGPIIVDPHHHRIHAHSRLIRGHSRSRSFRSPARQSTSAAGFRGHRRARHPRSIPLRTYPCESVSIRGPKKRNHGSNGYDRKPTVPPPSTRHYSRSFACHSRPFALKSEPCAHGTPGNLAERPRTDPRPEPGSPRSARPECFFPVHAIAPGTRPPPHRLRHSSEERGDPFLRMRPQRHHAVA